MDRASDSVVQTRTRAPKIASGVVTSLRAMLFDEGLWPRVRDELARRDPFAVEEIDEKLRHAWTDVSVYVDILDALDRVVGLDRSRELGRTRISHERRQGFFAHVIRSWLRSFGDDPQLLLRLTIPLWNATFRGAGTLSMLESRPGFVRLRIRDCAPELMASPAWKRSVEGMFQGGLEWIGVRAEPEVAPAQGEAHAIDYTIRWAIPD